MNPKKGDVDMSEENHKSGLLLIRPLKRRQGKGVFISYCHGEGDAFKELLIKKLTPLIGPGAEILDDDMMEAGDDWKVEVSDWLQRSRVAILLVTKSVPDSEPIRDFELCEIQKRVETGELVFLWLHVQKSDYSKLGIQDFIAPHDVKNPIEDNETFQRKALDEVFRITNNVLRGRQVIVAGSLPKGQTGEEFKRDCKDLGTALIRKRFSLICGSWNPDKADFHCFTGAVCQARGAILSGDTGVITCIGTQKGFSHPIPPDTKDYIGRPSILRTSLESRVRQVEQADIVVLIGGGTGSGDLVYETAWQRKLVIPTGKYGGTGKAMYKGLSRRLKRSISDMCPEQIGGGNTKDALFRLVDGLKENFDVDSIITLLKVFC